MKYLKFSEFQASDSNENGSGGGNKIKNENGKLDKDGFAIPFLPPAQASENPQKKAKNSNF